MLDRTLERVSCLSHKAAIVSSAAHHFLVKESISKQKDILDCHLILEPYSKNTAPAMAMAALSLEKDDDLLLVCPADHHIPNHHEFTNTVKQGISAAQSGAIVTFGVTPSAPKSSYGYIQKGEQQSDSSYFVERFIEKPSQELAEQLLFQGTFLWNAGIFLLSRETLLTSLKQHEPEMYTTVLHAMEYGKTVAEEHNKQKVSLYYPDSESVSTCKAESFDYAVLEHSSDTRVIPFHGQWSDVGSWTAIADMQPKDDRGNVLHGDGIIQEAQNTYVHSTHRPVVALGTSDLLVIDTPDALLVAHPDKAENVKEVVTQLENKKFSEAHSHRKVVRPWGWYDSVDKGERYQTKHIFVHPGASLSLQKHHHRAEHWVVVKGTAQVTRGNESYLLSENQSTYIPIGEIHQLSNPGKIPLELIEVQSGSYLGEDDIVRFEQQEALES